jgi:hypothetical protein
MSNNGHNHTPEDDGSPYEVKMVTHYALIVNQRCRVCKEGMGQRIINGRYRPVEDE